MLVNHRHLHIFQATADIIQQYPHSNTTIGSFKQVFGYQPAGNIRVKNVVLDIQTLIGHVDQFEPRSQRIITLIQQGKSRQRFICWLLFGDILAEARLGVGCHVIRGQFSVADALCSTAQQNTGKCHQPQYAHISILCRLPDLTDCDRAILVPMAI